MRKILTLVCALAGSAALAQAPFTIVKPRDGQTVRETVPIVMPKDSVPPGSFVGVTVDGKFLEATVPLPDAKKKSLVYNLDTKTKNIADGPHTIGLTLFTNVGGRPKIADKSEVKVSVGNHTGIRVPANGLVINYKFRPGAQWVYSVTAGQELSTLSEAQNKLGGRAAQLPLGSENVRMLFATDDVKPGGLAVVRTQLLPYKGKDYIVVTTSGEDKPTKHTMDEFAPIYRLLKPTGQEVYGDIPIWWGMAGTGGGKSVEKDLIVFIPLPILPSERLQIGESWQANIALGDTSIPEIQNQGKTVSKIPARGTFEAVEWEQGKPCARLRYELEFAQRSKETKGLTIAGREFKDNDKLRFQQLAWISLDDGKLVRSDIVIEADTKVDQGGGGPGGGDNGPGPSGGGNPMAPGKGGSRNGPGPAGGGGVGINAQAPAGKGGGGARPGGPGGQGMTPGGQQRGGSGGGGIFVRMKIYIHMVLEK